jgi:hypothetical protein
VGSSILKKFYGLTNFLMDLDHGLYESIGVHEMSAFNLKQTYCLLKVCKTYILVYKKIRVPNDLPYIVIF